LNLGQNTGNHDVFLVFLSLQTNARQDLNYVKTTAFQISSNSSLNCHKDYVKTTAFQISSDSSLNCHKDYVKTTAFQIFSDSSLNCHKDYVKTTSFQISSNSSLNCHKTWVLYLHTESPGIVSSDGPTPDETIGRGKQKCLEKTLPHYYFVHHKSHMNYPGIEPRSQQ
jgi:hypothetical protein